MPCPSGPRRAPETAESRCAILDAVTRTLLVALALLLVSSPARAEGWALEDWLAEPDVKLVAVEFYADWCEPCKKSAPRWEALRKKYAPQGLKLVVVNISEKTGGQGRCT